MSTWAAIVRVSHMNGRKAGEENVHADRDQLAAIERHAREHKARLEVLPPELDVSGGLPLEQRPSLLRAIEGVECGEFDGIIVAYLSRLGRNVREQLRAWDRVEAAGGRIVVVQEGIDTSTPNGRMHRTILLAIAEHEREQHGERFENLRRWATEAGIWQRRQTPRGYRKDKATRRLVPDRNAGQVRAAMRDLLAGTTILELSRRLGMTPSGVRALLRNEVYLGFLRVGPYVNESAHEPLIDRETFDAVQHKLASAPRPARNASAGPALLTGLVRCSSCGHRMTRGNSGGRPVYTCVRNHSGQPCPRPAAVTASLLDAHVEPIALAELARLQVTVTEGDRIGQAQERVRTAERELRTYLEAVKAAEIGAEAVTAAARKRKEELDDANAELQAELARRPVLPEVGSGADVWKRLGSHDRNTVLRSLLSAIVVEPCGRGRRVPLGDRVRVLVHGADIALPDRRGGEASGIAPIPLPDVDHADVLRVANR
jgi:DNA invertase Pin-like site-specific DNA recombinase